RSAAPSRAWTPRRARSSPMSRCGPSAPAWRRHRTTPRRPSLSSAPSWPRSWAGTGRRRCASFTAAASRPTTSALSLPSPTSTVGWWGALRSRPRPSSKCAERSLLRGRKVDRRLIVVAGQTATGKTEAAAEVARALGGEVIGADAYQVYRGMDVGTAKPAPEVRALVRHHLVDVLDPSQEMTLALYLDMARAALEDIWARGKTP